MSRPECFEIAFESAAEGIADIERCRQYQRSQLYAFLHVVPLDVEDVRRIAEAVDQSALDAQLIIIRSVRLQLLERRGRNIKLSRLSRRQCVDTAATEALREG